MATLFKFTLPTLAIWLINPSLSLVDTAVVGMQSSDQLAALGPGCILCDMNGYFFTFIAVASASLFLTLSAFDLFELAKTRSPFFPRIVGFPAR